MPRVGKEQRRELWRVSGSCDGAIIRICSRLMRLLVICEGEVAGGLGDEGM
jgi:hypothetical protein